MLEFVAYSGTALLVIISLTVFRISRGIAYIGGIPQVGKSGILGYITTAVRYTLDAQTVILEGRASFSGRPFVVPTLSGPIFLLGPEYLDIVRSSTDEIFNEPVAVSEDLQLPHTMDAHQMENPYQANVLRTDVNRAIPTFIPEILDESILAIRETFGDEPLSLPVFDTMTHLIARISNRAILGAELCRNTDFLQAVVRFAETVTLIAPFIQWSPTIFGSVVYFILSAAVGGKQAPLKYIVPHVKKCMKEREQSEQKSTIAEFLVRAAPSHESAEGIAMRLMNINFGSIHTSSIFITQTLFEIALLSQEDQDSIRTEILDAMESEGGWTKGALLKLRKIDSALREIGRVYGLMHFALPRVAISGYTLPDGTSIPPGHRVAIDMKAVHFDPDRYPDPNRCDLFRFSKMRSAEGSDSKYGFATLDKHYLPFGAGRHACAGRFFAAMELKIMLAYILLNYEVRFPSGVVNRPTNIQFNGAIIPNSKARMVFKLRCGGVY